MEDLALHKLAKAFKDNHADIKSEIDALALWKNTYKGKFETSNDESWHWTAFGMAFLGFN